MSINWGQAQPAPLEFWRLVHSYFPNTRTLGIYNNPGHEDHDEGRALDLGLLVSRPTENALAWALIDNVLLPLKAEINWSYFIWDQCIWYPDARGKRCGPGEFQGDHTNHIHISWGRDASQKKSFPLVERALMQLVRDMTGATEDEGKGVSESRPYCR